MIQKIATVFCLLAFAFVSTAQLHAETKSNTYPLGTDPVTDVALGDAPVVYVHEGRELRFASDANVATFKKDPKTYLAKVDKLIAEQQTPTYPLKNCPISDEELGAMGKSINVVVNNRLIEVCCNSCVKKAADKSSDIFASIDKGIVDAQKPTYPLKTCLVTGEALTDKSVDYVFAGKLVRLSSEATITEFNKNPVKYLVKLDAAMKK